MFNRFCEIRIGDLILGGSIEFDGVNLIEPMNVGFTVEHTVNQTPNEAEILIYNPSPETQIDIEQEGLEVEIQAGYKNETGEYFGTIFKGITRRSTTTISGGIDIITKVWAGDGDDGYKYARLSQTFEAGGNDPKTLVDALAAKLADKGIEIGEIRIEGPPDERATTVDRPVRYELDDICRRYNSHWTIHNNILYVWPKTEPIKFEPLITLSAEFGLIDAPEPTESGVRIKTLMIHELWPGHLVELIATTDRRKNRNIDGYYRVESIIFSGELMQGAFIADLECRRFEGEVQPSRNKFAGEGGQ